MFFMRKTIPFELNKDVPLNTPIEDISFVVFDTETTGFDIATNDRLIEIASVSVEGMTVHEDSTFQTYVNPKRQISREITELTKISGNTVENAPDSLQAIQSFFQHVQKQDCVCFVGHYVAFDLLVLKHELKRYKLTFKKQQTIDTLDLIGFLAPSYDMRDLHKYASAFSSRIYERHTALGDTLTTAYLFVELLFHFKNRGYHTWGDLLRATDSQNRSIFT
ncbi:3'-5' exonuclease [Litchfieldia alkalitelluris]|uniref:3'-5' exonuclease n=1 Tax=Litchfieldia alkalitelluris TaxID=304268 RepID=UPI0009978F34|nr:exonuclease domain-containing protein [Litchfieldia alkalitelluris]